jgi:hypothetical protein
VAQLGAPADRELFERSSSILRGLAEKHGGQLRLHPGGIDLVLLACAVATLRVEPQGVVLEGGVPHRTRIELGRNGLAEAFDRVEGLIRKRLNDKKVRDSEESFRSRLLGILARLSSARSTLRWPSGSQEPDPVDFLAVDADGRPVVGAIRRELDLEQLGSILDALGVLQPRLPALLAEAAAPVRWERPRLLLAAQRIEAAVERALRALAIRTELFDVETRRGEPFLVAREVGEPLRAAGIPSAAVTEQGDAAEAPRSEPSEARRGPRAHRFEEISVFELAEEGAGDAAPEVAREGRRRRRRRGRGRGRGRESAPTEEPSAGAPEEAQADEAVTALAQAGNGSAEEDTAAPDETDRERPRGETETVKTREILLAEDVDDEDTLSPLSPELLEAVVEPEPAYDDEEEADDELDPELERLRLEREARRRARLAELEPEPEPVRRPPRRRAAFVALADRDALGATVLLARDLRLVEGIWVYPQDELMTFFRSVATDLHEATPIYLVGFTASPARDTLQAASLYRDRLFWFDYHTWPPEDLEGLREAIDPEAVHVEPGCGSALPVVLSYCTRRSRFSDKLADLLRGRFTQHDYERWGRLWWWRLEEIAARPGERRSDLTRLLTGRPSDLAQEAGEVPLPASPPELEYVAGRDFRLVHFGGYSAVLVPVADDLDVYLTARIARERYGAPLSLAWKTGSERLVLAADEISSRPAFDLGAVVDHLVEKFDWVEALTDADHVARIRMTGLSSRPERLDEIIGEIAMGRSILEG